jgi:putative ABC transport system ATP-binding protein
MQPKIAQAVQDTAQPQDTAIFVVKRLAKTYQMGEVKVTALVEVDLTICKGEFISALLADTQAPRFDQD